MSGTENVMAPAKGEAFYVEELRARLGEAHPEASLHIEVCLPGCDVLVGRASVVGVEAEGPDGLGFHSCKLRLEMDRGDLLTSPALAEMPAWALEKVARTGKAIEPWELYEGDES